ncbi:MAG: hypothetical protein MZU97_09150 [Bacillus subtilis]|nr:hypothetical protein [Bacillus subtilis]
MQAQAMDISRKMSDKIVIPFDASALTEKKAVSFVGNPVDLSESTNLSKDRKGSNPFAILADKKDKRENEENAL